MPRTPKPWFRASTGKWYAQLDGKQVPLARGKKAKKEAQQELHRILASGGISTTVETGSGLTVRDVANLFLARCRTEVKPVTAAGYGRHLKTFVDQFGHIPAAEVKPLHVTRWLESHPWNPTTQHGAATAARAAFRWAWKQGHLKSDPLEHVQKPTPRRREKILDEGQVDAVIAAYGPSDPFRDLLVVLRETGARPGELAAMTAEGLNLEAGYWEGPSKTTRRTGKARVIVLNSRAVEVLRRLAEKHPEGHLFRNARGGRWTRNAMACRFARLRKKTGMDGSASANSLRHGFTTSALERGVPVAVVAELLGHRDSAMISRHYSHLGDRREHLRAQAERATGREDPPTDGQ